MDSGTLLFCSDIIVRVLGVIKGKVYMVSQSDATLLFSLEKTTKEDQYILPDHEEVLTLELVTTDTNYKTELFQLDINRKYIELKKRTFQKRVQQSIVLRRLDFYGSHRNPTISSIPASLDDAIIDLMRKYEEQNFRKKTHLHFYIEGYGERWAFPLDEFSFLKAGVLTEQLEKFFIYCNILDMPKLTKEGLFWQQ